MMISIKPSDQSTIHVVGRVDAVLLAKSIATAPQSDIERATNLGINQAAVLTKGSQYTASVIAKNSNPQSGATNSASNGTNSASNGNSKSNATADFDVEIAGLKLSMQLGANITVGQKLLMTYVGGDSPPKFQLSANNGNVNSNVNTGTTLQLSSAASFIQQTLQQSLQQSLGQLSTQSLNQSPSQLLAQAQSAGSNQAQLISSQIISNQPQNPALMAQQLKATLVSSGLFYESHLASFVEGTFSLQALKQEPQNVLVQQTLVNTTQANALQNQLSPAQVLLPQQLALLETSHFNWQGQVWPGQVMQWDVWAKNADSDQAQQQSSASVEQKGASQLTLDLPNLGKVMVKLDYQEGKMRVNVQAVQADTATLLKNNKRNLIQALQVRGQQLESVVVG